MLVCHSQQFRDFSRQAQKLPAGVAKVVKLGKGVKSLKEGQRVVGVPWTGLYGTWQQYHVMPAESLVTAGVPAVNSLLMPPGRFDSSDACCRCQCQTSCQTRWRHNSG